MKNIETSGKFADFAVFTSCGKLAVKSSERFGNIKEIGELMTNDELSFLKNELHTFGKAPFILVNTKLSYALAVRKFYEKERLYVLIFATIKDRILLSGFSQLSQNESVFSDEIKEKIKNERLQKDTGGFFDFYDLLRETFSFGGIDIGPLRHVYKETESKIVAFSKLFGININFGTLEDYENAENHYNDYSPQTAITIFLLIFEFCKSGDSEVKIAFEEGIDGMNISFTAKKSEEFPNGKMPYLEYISGLKNLTFFLKEDKGYCNIKTSFRTNSDYCSSLKQSEKKFYFN